MGIASFDVAWCDLEEMGMPSKEEVAKEAQAQADLDRRLAEDSKRIGIN